MLTELTGLRVAAATPPCHSVACPVRWSVTCSPTQRNAPFFTPPAPARRRRSRCASAATADFNWQGEVAAAASRPPARWPPNPDLARLHPLFSFPPPPPWRQVGQRWRGRRRQSRRPRDPPSITHARTHVRPLLHAPAHRTQSARMKGGREGRGTTRLKLLLQRHIVACRLSPADDPALHLLAVSGYLLRLDAPRPPLYWRPS